jgi:phosphocarrier protein HPr
MLTLDRRQMRLGGALGLHLRAAGKFANLARSFQSEVRVYCNGKEASGRSILELIMLAAEEGMPVEIEATGPDAEAALDALAELIETGVPDFDDGAGSGH